MKLSWRCLAYGLVLLLAIVLVANLYACRSISGHKVIHGPGGTIVDVKDVKGLPIVVQTPEKAMFILTINRYQLTRVSQSEDDAGTVITTRDDLGEVVETSVSEEPILLGKSEIYTIDPKRPFFGSIDYAIELENQYPTRVSGKLDDKTLEQLRQLAMDLAAAAREAPAPRVAGTLGVELGARVSLERRPIEKDIRFIEFDLVNGGPPKIYDKSGLMER